MILKTRKCRATVGFGLPILGCDATDENIGTVTLRWQAPVENEDGSPLIDLAHYPVYWGPPERSFVN